MTTLVRSWAPALAVLLLGACTFGTGPQAASDASASPSSGSPTASALPSASRTGGSGPADGARAPASGAGVPSATTTSSRLLRLTTTARIPLAGQTYGRELVLFGRYAAWVGCDGCQRTFVEPTTLYVADLRTRAVRAVATAPPHGSVGPIGGFGTRLVYVAGAAAGGRTMRWTTYALDLATGRRTTLAGWTQTASATPPAAAVGAGHLLWQTFPGGPGADHGPVIEVDLRTGARRTLSRDLPGILGALTGAGLVYRAGDANAALLPAGGPPAITLSDRHDVRQIVADDSTVAWQTDDGPDAATWATSLDRLGPPKEYYRGSTGDRAVGTGFLAVVTGGDEPVLLLYPLGDGPVVAVGDVPGEFDSVAAEGARLAYLAMPGDRGVQPDARHPITLVVTTVGLPGR